MSKKNDTPTQTKKPFRIAIGPLLPVVKIVGSTLLGKVLLVKSTSGGVPSPVVIAGAMTTPGIPMKTRLARGANIFVSELGYWPGFNDGGGIKSQTTLTDLAVNVGLGYAGAKVVHKGAEKMGTNNALRQFGSPVVF